MKPLFRRRRLRSRALRAACGYRPVECDFLAGPFFQLADGHFQLPLGLVQSINSRHAARFVHVLNIYGMLAVGNVRHDGRARDLGRSLRIHVFASISSCVPEYVALKPLALCYIFLPRSAKNTKHASAERSWEIHAQIRDTRKTMGRRAPRGRGNKLMSGAILGG